MPTDLMPKLVVALLATPVVGAAVVALLGDRRRDAVRWVSLAAALVTLGLAAVVSVAFARQTIQTPPTPAASLDLPTFRPVFVPGSPGQRVVGRSVSSGFVTKEDVHATSWDVVRFGDQGEQPGAAAQFYVGIDGLNVWLVLLTAVLMLPAVLISWNHVDERVNEFFAWLLALQTAMMGIFLSFDIILFYVFFELSLVPLFFLIGIWGGSEKRYAARKFFIYTLTGSVVTLLGVLGIVIACYSRTGELSFSLPRLVEIVHTRLVLQDATEQQFWNNVQFWVFLALMAGFAVKVPLVPFHTWLPLAHVEAPTAGSVDLAGVLLKVGAYGFLRLCVPLAPDTSLVLGLPLVTSLAAIGIVYGSFCAFAQNDIKKLVAYSSVSHLGLCMLGMFALNVAGLSGSMLQMVNHGLSTAALFLLVGMLYERYHTRLISDYGGMAGRLPILSVFMIFVCLTSIGLPGLNGFVGEALVMMGVFELEWKAHRWPALAVIAGLGMVLGAWYLLTMVRRTFFGPVKEPAPAGRGDHGPVRDLSFRELAIVVPLAAMCVAIGVYPQPILDAAKPDLAVIADIADRARSRAGGESRPVPVQAALEARGR